MPSEDKAITSIFDWSHPRDLTEHSAKEMGLVKAVVMMEGEARRTDKDGNTFSIGTMTKDNVIFGGGGLRALALSGQAPVDIDHHKEQLPESYATKYGLNRNRPIVGHVIDAQFSQTSDGKATIEAIMVIHDKAVYKLIEEGKIVGNSVTDFSRGKNCDDDNSCSFVGSTYRRNSLMLDAAPAMAGTWTAPVTAADIGTTIKPSEHRQTIPTTLLLGGETADVSTVFANNDEMSTFLTTQKGISDELAAEITETAMSTPGTLSASQMIGMDGSDLQLWWTTRSAHTTTTTTEEHDTTVQAEAVEAIKTEPEKVQMDKDEMIKLLEDTGYKVEPPQTTPQTEAPATEKVDAPEPKPEPEDVKVETETATETPEPEVEEPTTEEHKVQYIPGGADPTGLTEDIARLRGVLGGLKLAHNSISLPEKVGGERKKAIESRAKIVQFAIKNARDVTKLSGKQYRVQVRNHGKLNIIMPD